MHRTQLMVSAMLILASLGRLAAQEISFTPLGDFPGGAWDSRATDVSADGTIVVGTGVDFQGNTKAFRWTSAGGMLDLGSLPGGANSFGASVSADGSVVAGTSDSSNAQSEAFRWSSGAGMVGLGTLEPLFRSVGGGVSGDGSTIVGYAETLAAQTEAFRWTAPTGMVRLSGVPAGTRSSVATAASLDGSIVIGTMTRSDGRQEAFRWNATDGVVGLGFADSLDVHSTASGITPDGQTIVGNRTGSDGRTRGFRWAAAGGMEHLGGTLEAFPLDVSADGSVIVGSTISLRRAAVLTEGGVGDIQDFLESNGIDLQGWNLEYATGVSADGRTIVGFGRGPRGQEAWIATIPEPSTLALSGFAATGLLGYLMGRWMGLRSA